MMTCDKNTRLLVGFLDGELSDSEMEQVDAHMAECSHCAEQARKLSVSLDVFKSIGSREPTSEISPYLPERIAAHAADWRRSQRSWRLRFAFGLGATALLVGLSVGYIFGPQVSQPEKGPSVASIRIEGQGIGFEIDRDSFILHSKDKRGEKGIDLKF